MTQPSQPDDRLTENDAKKVIKMIEEVEREEAEELAPPLVEANSTDEGNDDADR